MSYGHHIYYNKIPASEKIQIVFIENKNSSVSITMYDINGKEVKKKITKNNFSEIDIHELDQGVYFLKVVTNNINESRKVVIVR